MNVYDISVRKLQRVQVREYEPAEAEITLRAQVAEGEDYNIVMERLIADATIGVNSALGFSPSGKIVLEKTVSKAPTPAAKPAPAAKVEDDFGEEAPAKPKAEATAEAPKRRGRPPKAKPADDDGFGEDTPPKKAPAKGEDDDFDAEEDSHRRDAGGEDDFGDEAPAKPAPAKAAEPAKTEKPKKRDDAEEDIRKYLTDLVTSKKIAAADIRLIVKEKYNAASMKEIPDSYLPELKELVELKMAADEL